MMDRETRCPNCGTTKYANANLRMMVNVCGHSLCESCVEQLFVKGAAKCPTCNTLLKRVQFRIKLYDDDTIEKDLEIRKNLLKEINLKEEDFDTLSQYNDYLEMFETFVWNLANNIDVQETMNRIEQFKSENSTKLRDSRQKISKDLELIEQILEEEMMEEGDRKNLIQNEEIDLAARKVKEYKENLIDALTVTDMPAELVLRNHQKQAENDLARLEEQIDLEQKKQYSNRMKRQQKITSTGIVLGVHSKVFTSDNLADRTERTRRFVYEPIKFLNDGPSCPTPRTIQNDGYLQNVRKPNQSEIAGGFNSLYPCLRALQEAIFDLSFNPSI
ncbi:hypothetical protein NH340_JMT02102 [Sarcoptes scabiei]|nr:hypothetical protein NH340_JMT02102 [Sarcoptes scabiei]